MGSLGGFLLAAVGLVVVLFVVGRATVHLHRSGTRQIQFSVRQTVAMVLVPLCGATLVVQGTGPGRAVTGAPATLSTLCIDIVATTLVGSAGMGALLIGLGIRAPGANEPAIPTDHATRRTVGVLVWVVGWFAVSVEVVTSPVPGVHPYWQFLLVGGCLTGLFVPVLYESLVPAPFVGGPYRLPAEREQFLVETCCERFDAEPSRVIVSRLSLPLTPSIVVAGRGPFRTVLVNEDLLDRLEEDELAVALAEATARQRPGFLSWQLVGATVAGVLVLTGLGLLGGATPLTPRQAVAPMALLTLGSGYLLVRTGRWARRQTYAADDFAARHLGTAQVVAAYESFEGDISYLPGAAQSQDRSAFWRVGTTDPSVGRRIERLRDRTDRPAAEADTPSTLRGRVAARLRDRRVWVLAPLWLSLLVVPTISGPALVDDPQSASLVVRTLIYGPAILYLLAIPVVALVAVVAIYRERGDATSGYDPSWYHYAVGVPIANMFLSPLVLYDVYLDGD